jgi:hypothetical protein
MSTHAVVLLQIAVDWYGAPRHFDAQDVVDLVKQGLEGHYTNVGVSRVNEAYVELIADEEENPL